MEEVGYVFRIVSSRNVTSCFNQLQCYIKIDKLYRHSSGFFMLLFILLFSHLQFQVQVWFSHCPPPHVEKDVVKREKAFEGTGKTAFMGCEEQAD